MNRRQFLTRLSTAAVGVCVASKIPTAWLPAPVRRTAALEFLRNAWNAAAKGRGSKDWPQHMYAGRELFEAARGEMTVIMRETLLGGVLVSSADPENTLFFKGSVLHCEGRGWVVRIPLSNGGLEADRDRMICWFNGGRNA